MRSEKLRAAAGKTGGRKFRFLLPFLACVFFLANTTRAQEPSHGGVDRVQALYAQARAAEARGDLASAIAKYKTILQIEPGLAPAYNNLGALYLKRSEFRKAAAILRKGLKINPGMHSALALLGISLYEMRQYGSARSPLEDALRANPKDSHLEFFLANDLIKLGEYEPAEIHLQRLAQREPGNQNIWYLLGQVYTKLAEASFAKVDAINPDSVLSHEIRGDVMASMKNYLGALIEYKKAVELGPKKPGTHYKLGNAYWKLDDWGPATKEFKAELSIDPSNCDARWKLGDILLQQHLDPKQALADVSQALSQCSYLTDARVDRARALMLLNRPAEALPDLKIAEKALPDERIVHFLLAQAFRRLGQMKKAQAEMEIFAKLEESSRAAEANRAKQMLQLRNPGKPHLKP